MDGYDVVVIGAGTAGSIVASRLTEDPARSVLLLEAGPSYLGSTLPTDLTEPWISLEAHDWGFDAEFRPGRRWPYPRGRVVGGSSAVNAGVYMRPTPEDLGRWEAAGCPGWGYDDVLPWFVRAEDDPAGDPAVHGRGGPVPLRRRTLDGCQPAGRAFASALVSLGFDVVEDDADPKRSGVTPLASNVVDGMRVSMATAYLEPARERPNLTVSAGRLADRVVVSGGRATGVEVVAGGRRERIGADRVVVCGGAVSSPALLMRSGIGPPDALRAAGVEPVAALVGVGGNLIDHCVAMVYARAAEGLVNDPDEYFELYLRHDRLYLALLTLFSPRTLGVFFGDATSPPLVALAAGVALPASRGSVTLAGPEPDRPPRIDLGFLATADDVAVLRDAMALAGRLLGTPPFDACAADVVAPGPGVLGTVGALDDYVRATCATGFHPLGTCRMGRPEDPGAVVGPDLGVHGVDRLFVADASVVPVPLSAPTNATTVMIGERAAELLGASR